MATVATGARLEMSSPMACGSDSGRTFVSRNAKVGPTTQPHGGQHHQDCEHGLRVIVRVPSTQSELGAFRSCRTHSAGCAGLFGEYACANGCEDNRPQGPHDDHNHYTRVSVRNRKSSR